LDQWISFKSYKVMLVFSILFVFLLAIGLWHIFVGSLKWGGSCGSYERFHGMLWHELMQMPAWCMHNLRMRMHADLRITHSHEQHGYQTYSFILLMFDTHISWHDTWSIQTFAKPLKSHHLFFRSEVLTQTCHLLREKGAGSARIWLIVHRFTTPKYHKKTPCSEKNHLFRWVGCFFSSRGDRESQQSGES